MFHITKFKPKQLFTIYIKHLFASTHKLHEIKNNSMLIIEDNNKILPYMSEIQLQNGARGIVMKIQDKGNVYVGMYQQFKPLLNQNQVNIININKNWKQSTKTFIKNIVESQSETKGIFDINTKLVEKNLTLSTLPNQQQNYKILNGKKRRIKSSSPILNICNDIYYGNMISFMGCKGSKKSQNSWYIAKDFTQNFTKSVTIYVNPYFKQVKQFSQICPQSISLTIPHSKLPTDIGVYMLTLKAINMSCQLKKKGFDVLLIVDNLSDIMLREWNLLQSIKFNSKVTDSSKLFQYNTLKISPISILNEIYSNCEDNNSYMNNDVQIKKKGSLTSILISEKQNNELVQQITSYSNNLKHLQTLSQVIQFPLNFKINTNLYYPKPKTEEEFNNLKGQKGFYQKQMNRFLRSFINKYLNEKNQTQLKRQLYKNDIKDAPWDYFFLLDAQWWTTGIKQISNSLKSYKQANQFLRWIVYNIKNDYVGHWNLSAKQSYFKLLAYVKHQQNLKQNISNEFISFTDQQLQTFIDDAKMQGLINPFKKDYLI